MSRQRKGRLLGAGRIRAQVGHPGVSGGGPSKGIPVKSGPEPAVPPSGILLPRQLSFEMVVGEDAGSVGGYWTRHASPLLQHRRTKSPSFPLT